MHKEIAAILAHTLPPEQHAQREVKLGTRGGFSIFAKKKPPLYRLFKAGRITFDQMLAGEWMEEDARTSGIYAPSAMMICERTSGSSERKMSERQLEAWQRYFRTCKEITRQLGSEAQQTVVAVAVYGYTPTETCLLPVNKRTAALAAGLQVAYDFLFTPREQSANVSSW